MTFNRFCKLRNNVHFCVEYNSNKADMLWKVRPLYDVIRNHCLTLPLEKVFSIDEQMVSFKGTFELKQYMSKKPSK